jgi:hypothetical protein
MREAVALASLGARQRLVRARDARRPLSKHGSMAARLAAWSAWRRALRGFTTAWSGAKIERLTWQRQLLSRSGPRESAFSRRAGRAQQARRIRARRLLKLPPR